MKQIWLRKTGGPHVLKVEDAPDLTEVSERQVLIDVHYSGINFADIIMRLGMYKDAPKGPFVPGYEVSGIVKKVGKAVRTFRVGDQVVAGSLFGGYSSQICVDEDLVFKMPAHLTLAEAAGLPVNWITADAALLDMGRVRRGDRVLVDSATGGVGTIALQILKQVGAQVVGLTSSTSKLTYIAGLGAKAMTVADFNASKEGSFDLVLNSQGGRSIRDHYNRLAVTGRVVAFGMSTAVKDGKRDTWGFIKAVLTMPWFWTVSMFDKNRGVYALNALRLLEDTAYRKSLRAKWVVVETIRLKPHIDKIFKAEDVAAAHAHLQSKAARGKVVLKWV